MLVLNADYKTKSRALLGAGLCDWASHMPVKPVWQQNNNSNKTNMTFTIFKQLILCSLYTTIRFLTFTVFSCGKSGISLTNSIHLWKTIMTASLEAEKREESARKMFPCTSWSCECHCSFQGSVPEPGLINLSGSLRWRCFINVFGTCLAASGLNGLQRPVAEEERERDQKKKGMYPNRRGREHT